ncbi:MAG: peptide deformylase [Clostridiales bacterium]|nr:peptide deformylase [Clostridiales bacterium]
MALRKVRVVEDPVLRKRAKEIKKFDVKLKELSDDLIETMYEEDGVGLAANQVGILKRIIAIDIYDGSGPKILINPEIIYEEGEQLEVEGCLSVPNVTGYVRRPLIVKAKAQDLAGNSFEILGEGLLARALCHEIDHLNGVLFIDKMEIKEDEE